MWILVNNIPVNVFDDFFASTVIEFNKEFVSNNIWFYKDDNHSSRSISHIILNVAASKKWMEVETMESEQIERKSHNDYTYYDTKYIQKYDDSLTHDGHEFFNIQSGYFFYVSDNKRVVLSQLYQSKESAQEALEKLLSTVNKIVARLQRVTI